MPTQSEADIAHQVGGPMTAPRGHKSVPTLPGWCGYPWSRSIASFAVSQSPKRAPHLFPRERRRRRGNIVLWSFTAMIRDAIVVASFCKCSARIPAICLLAGGNCPDWIVSSGMQCIPDSLTAWAREAQIAPCSHSTQAICNAAVRPLGAIQPDNFPRARHKSGQQSITLETAFA